VSPEAADADIPEIWDLCSEQAARVGADPHHGVMTTVAHGVGERLGERLGERVQRIPATDLRSYVLAVLEEIHRVIPSTFSCFGVADPATGLLACSIKSQEPPCSDEEIVLHELAGPDVNQFADLARRADPVGSLWLDTDGRPETCHRFADFLEPRLGAIDELRIAFTGDGLLWAGLAMHRDRGEAPFSHSDRDVLRRMIPTVVDGLRHSLFHGVPVEGNDRWIQAPAVIMVTASGFQASSAGLAAIDDLGGLDHGDLPTSMLSVVGSVRSGAPAAMVRTRDTTGRWVTIRAAPLSDGASVVLSVTATSAVELFPLATGAFGLTRREQEVADLVLQGTSTAAIAKALVLSPHTVQDHLKSIFRKFGVASRRDLVGRFIGTQ
jgi:DNA-binding CsgD family transcriptional regulator